MKLEELPKKNIYQVPPDYFERLSGKVMARVTQDASASNNVFWLWQANILRPALAGLALVLSFALIFILGSNPPVNSPSQELLSNVTEKEALEYLLQSEHLEAHDLAELSQSKKDLLHEFIQATPEEIEKEVDLADVEEYYLN